MLGLWGLSVGCSPSLGQLERSPQRSRTGFDGVDLGFQPPASHLSLWSLMEFWRCCHHSDKGSKERALPYRRG